MIIEKEIIENLVIKIFSSIKNSLFLNQGTLILDVSNDISSFSKINLFNIDELSVARLNKNE